MRRLYVVLTGLMMLSILAQFYFAAVGAFAKPQDDSSFAVHDVNGMMILPLLSIAATVVALLARAPGRQVGLTIAPLGLVLVQVLIVELGRALDGPDDATTPWSLTVLGLHAVNGLAIMAVAGLTMRGARALLRPAGDNPATAAHATSPSAGTSA